MSWLMHCPEWIFPNNYYFWSETCDLTYAHISTNILTLFCKMHVLWAERCALWKLFFVKRECQMPGVKMACDIKTMFR